MLSEEVLEQFTRKTALARELITTAWPDLSVEAKLQVIDTIQRIHFSSTPDWLLTLALSDQAAIVRFWAAKHAYFPLAREAEAGITSASELDEQEQANRARAEGDSCGLVREIVGSPGGFFGPQVRQSQIAKLLTIRNETHDGLSGIIPYLREGFAAGVPDDELAECSDEYFARPGVRARLEEDDHLDGMSAHTDGSYMKEGWDLVKKAGPRLALSLAQNLPTKLGLGRMELEQLIEMPSGVLGYFASRPYITPEQQEVVAYIEEHFDKFPAEVHKRMSYPNASKEEWARRFRRSSTTRSSETLEALTELQDQLKDQFIQLQGQVKELQQSMEAKRSRFFGR